MYVCVCARVRECEVRTVIRDGARCLETVGDACGAGTSCGTCHDRICDLIDEEAARNGQLVGAQASRNALAGISA